MKKEKAFCVNLMCSGIIFQNLVLIWLTFFKRKFTYTYIAITTEVILAYIKISDPYQ